MKSEREKYVQQLHKKGYNCAQALLCGYQKELGMPEEVLFKLSEGLGRGVAGIEDMCCVPIIISMIISFMETSDGNVSNPQTKLNSYACSKCLIMEFKEKVGSTCCHDILENNKLCHKQTCCTDILLIGVKVIDQCLMDYT